MGLHPKDILTTTALLGPEQAPFRPALTREPGELPSQSTGLSKPSRTKEVKATNASKPLPGYGTRDQVQFKNLL